MSLTKRFLLGYLVIYIIAMLFVTVYTVKTTQNEIYSEVVTLYGNHFKMAAYDYDVFFENISADLETLAENPIVKTTNDRNFTSFLKADENTFKYNYTPEELKIINLFNSYRLTHPQVNSVYMGRSNGSFVRSHPRSAATAYDPRERLWYKIAAENPNSTRFTEAYTSLTTPDINIGTVKALTDSQNQVYGVIGIDVTLNKLSEHMSQMSLSYNGNLEFWDKNGLVIISPWKERLNLPGDSNNNYVQVFSQSGITLEKGETNFRVASFDNSNQHKLVAYLPLDVVTSRIFNEIISNVKDITLIMLLFACVTFLMLEFLILKPIRGMRSALKFSSIRRNPEKMNVKLYGELNEFQNEYNQLVSFIDADDAELKNVKSLAVTNLASLAGIRDYETGLHIVRTQKYVRLLAESYQLNFPERSLTNTSLEIMFLCAPLHDIGKVGIPDNILQKHDKLTAEEFEIMKTHTIIGKRSIIHGNLDIQDKLFINMATNMVFSHHERWDGSGYPQALAGEAIPLEARIMSIADVYDALTTKRVYKKDINHTSAVKIIMAGKGTQFDPELINLFIEVEDKFRLISELYKDN